MRREQQQLVALNPRQVLHQHPLQMQYQFALVLRVWLCHGEQPSVQERPGKVPIGSSITLQEDLTASEDTNQCQFLVRVVL